VGVKNPKKILKLWKNFPIEYQEVTENNEKKFYKLLFNRKNGMIFAL